MYKITVLLPTRDNADRPLDTERSEILREILTQFGGYTRHSKTSGAWLDPATGIVYEDEMTPISVFVESDQDRKKMIKLSESWAGLLRQEALMLSWVEENFQFIHPSSRPVNSHSSSPHKPEDGIGADWKILCLIVAKTRIVAADERNYTWT